MKDLLPCPFCGSTRAALGTSQDDGITKWSVICPECGSSCSLYCDSERDAVELWNMRAQPQYLAGCLHPGTEPLSCQYEGKCLSEACNHHGKVWYGPRMTLEAQDPNLLYPKGKT